MKREQLTPAQLAALRELFSRNGPVPTETELDKLIEPVRPEFCGGGAVLLPWLGMWLGIEPDGYIHS